MSECQTKISGCSGSADQVVSLTKTLDKSKRIAIDVPRDHLVPSGIQLSSQDHLFSQTHQGETQVRRQLSARRLRSAQRRLDVLTQYVLRIWSQSEIEKSDQQWIIPESSRNAIRRHIAHCALCDHRTLQHCLARFALRIRREFHKHRLKMIERLIVHARHYLRRDGTNQPPRSRTGSIRRGAVCPFCNFLDQPLRLSRAVDVFDNNEERPFLRAEGPTGTE